MAKITLNNIGNLENEASVVSTINANNQAIRDAIENTVFRDGTTPNHMTDDLDLNSNRILNLPEPVFPNDPVRLQDLAGYVTNVPLPTAEEEGFVLTATAADTYDWQAAPATNSVPLPTGGETGYVLTATGANTYDWQTAPTTDLTALNALLALTNAGTSKQVFTTTLSGPGWVDLPYDLAFMLEYVPTSDEIIGRYVSTRAFSIPAGATGSLAKAGTAATAETIFTLKKNGASFGSITFAASGTTGTFAVASTTSFAAGDILTIHAPNTADATISKLGITFIGTLI